MKKPYFQSKPTTGNPYRARNNYKAARRLPPWVKLLTGGMLALVALMLLVPLIPMKSQAYNAQLREKTERIRAQIVEGKFHDVFIEGDRDLIKYNDEGEFVARLAAGQKFLAGKYEKSGGDSVHYEDLFNRLKDIVGRPALVVSGYTLKGDAGNADEVYYWIVRGDELKLVDYRFSPRKY
jgi:hypothetical protein